MNPEEYIQARPIINVYGETEQEVNLRREFEGKVNEYLGNQDNLSESIRDVEHEVDKLDSHVDDCDEAIQDLQDEYEKKVEELEDRIETLEKQMKLLIEQLNERGINVDCDPEDD